MTNSNGCQYLLWQGAQYAEGIKFCFLRNQFMLVPDKNATNIILGAGENQFSSGTRLPSHQTDDSEGVLLCVVTAASQALHP